MNLFRGKKTKSKLSSRILVAGVGLIAFFFAISAIYLASLYRQLNTAFRQEDQFVPTRIYSDVLHIIPAQGRVLIETRLKRLGYHYQASSDLLSLQFNLHPLDYPAYLLPEQHPQHDQAESEVILHFDGKDSKALLQSIELKGQEIPDLYLEPELVATLSRNGDAKKEIRTSLKFEEIPSSVWKAIIAIEDQHFLDHSGLDPRGIARAMWINLKTLSFAQGGSTITQQLVKNLMARHTKNFFRKFNELFLALLLEAKFEKEQILERYLNEVYLGQVGALEIHGVAEGAEYFFGKRLEELNLAEVALMAGLIRGPGYYSPYRYKERALERQRLVLKKMVETGQIADAEAKAALKLPIRLAPPQTSSTKAPFFADYVKAELNKEFVKNHSNEDEMLRSGLKVYTTLDFDLNTQAQEAVTNGVASLEKRFKLPGTERLEGALASVDPSNGFIRALVGGKNYSKSNFNRILNMKRQVGSTFKPIVYLTAFQKGGDPFGIPYGPGYPVEDAPWTLVYDHGKQSWSPKNYEKDYRGWIPLKTAFVNSINTVAAKLGYQIGIENVIKTARALGIQSELPAVPSLSLGVSELSPIELLQVYSTLANHGQQYELSVIRGITQNDGTNYKRYSSFPKQAVEPGPVDLLTELLRGVMTEGTARSSQSLGLDRQAAGKTGTTSQHRDAWFAGYTPQLATVVWVGLDQNSAESAKYKMSLTGANSALPIWVSFMSRALANEPPQPFPESALLVDVQIDRYTGKQAASGCPVVQTSVEKYLRDHAPSEKSCAQSWPISGPPVWRE